ncbi:MAG: S-methyl-5'-thioadenosine phosphorylase [Candidatus Ranarchaeia archaeon]|jgi:5'-methylthioadenosine phosphorylase
MPRFANTSIKPVNPADKKKLQSLLPIDLGIFGGSGNYDPSALEDIVPTKVYTPYGAPSDFYMIGKMGGRKVAFLARHGTGHTILPHAINYRANIWGFKSLGACQVISPSACGSLQENLKPGTFVVVDQVFDRTFGQRKDTFYDGGVVAHIPFSEPYCHELRKVIIKQCRELKYDHQGCGTYVAINGPRFSSKAESLFYRKMGFDVVGMTSYPEVALCRELEMCYANVSMVTDMDVHDPEHPVTIDAIFAVMKDNVERVRKLIAAVVPNVPKDRNCDCSKLLDASEF